MPKTERYYRRRGINNRPPLDPSQEDKQEALEFIKTIGLIAVGALLVLMIDWLGRVPQ